MPKRLSSPERLVLQIQAERGVHECPWYAIDGESIVVAAVNRNGRLIAWETAKTEHDLSRVTSALWAALDADDPIPMKLVR